VAGGVDEGDVGEGLREVADEAASCRVVLLGEETDVARASSHALRGAKSGPSGLQASAQERSRLRSTAELSFFFFRRGKKMIGATGKSAEASLLNAT
jgi:hypothetical protein